MIRQLITKQFFNFAVPFEALYILDTDYQEYALIYGCRELVNDTKQSK